jgi:hypothetical protein
MREIIRKVLREEYNKKDIKSILFKFWDKNGPSLGFGKYLSLPEDDTLLYLRDYHGKNIEEMIKNEVKNLINNYHTCGEDMFNLIFNDIEFDVDEAVYDVYFSLDFSSDLFYDGFDFNDRGMMMSIFGSIERCTEKMLDKKIYDKYGYVIFRTLITNTYRSDV